MVFLLLGVSQTAKGQFQTTLDPQGHDFNHYSIEVSQTGTFYAVAGTLFDPSGNTKMHILHVDLMGAIVWERTLDLGLEDRVLDVETDLNDNIIVTGTTDMLGNARLYVAKLNLVGNLTHDFLLENDPGTATAGTKIEYITATDEFVVGGLISNNPAFSFPLNTNSAILLKLDNDLTAPAWIRIINGPETAHSSINDIVAVNNGLLFITGSLGLPLTVGGASQGVLAATINCTDGTTVNTFSFESTNSEHDGVSAVFDKASDVVFLMSNNSEIHNPQINRIDNVSTLIPGGAFMGGPGFYLELDPYYGAYNAAGFKLMEDPVDPNLLVAAGYFRTGPHAGNTSFWISKFDKSGSTPNVPYLVWDAPSVNFHTHGGGVFSTFQGEHPYIFTQEILTRRADYRGFVGIAPRELGGNYTIDLMGFQTTWLGTYAVDGTIGGNNLDISCFIPYNANVLPISYVDVPTFEQAFPTPGHPIMNQPEEEFRQTEQICEIIDCQIDYPIDIVAVPTSCNTVDISWAPVTGAISYQVRYRLKNTTTWNFQSSGTNSMTISGLLASRHYEYRVRARCYDGSYSPYAPLQRFFTAPCTPPQNFTVTFLAPDQVRINWEVIPGATQYKVRYRKVGTTAWTNAGNVVNKKTLSGLDPGARYQYRVNARCNGVCWSYFSDMHYFDLATGAYWRTDMDISTTTIPMAMEVYPNPADQMVHISLEDMNDEQEALIVIRDLTGKAIIERKQVLNNQKIDISDLPAGNYFITAYLNDGRFKTEKLVKR